MSTSCTSFSSGLIPTVDPTLVRYLLLCLAVEFVIQDQERVDADQQFQVGIGATLQKQ